MDGIERFVEAQQGDYEDALAEITAGEKQSHWIWYVFPQLKGLGMSWTSEFYGIADLDEAKAYLAHPVLLIEPNGVIAEVLDVFYGGKRDAKTLAMLGRR